MIVADNTFVGLMNKLETLHLFNTPFPKMEAHGTRFEYQDFVINLSIVNQSQTTKGVVLEVNTIDHRHFTSVRMINDRVFL